MLPVPLQCWSQTATWLGSRGLPPVLRCRALGMHKHRGEDSPKTSWMRFCTRHVCSVGRGGGGQVCLAGPNWLYLHYPKAWGGDEVRAWPCKQGDVGGCACPRHECTPSRG